MLFYVTVCESRSTREDMYTKMCAELDHYINYFIGFSDENVSVVRIFSYVLREMALNNLPKDDRDLNELT